MKKISSDSIATINLIFTPLLYMSILLPISLKFHMRYIFPIVIVAHTLLFWGLILYKEWQKDEI